MSWFTRPLAGSRSVPKSYRGTKLRIESLECRSLLTLLGAQLFPSDNPWNQRIADAPVAANSAAIMNNIITRSGDGRLHPDFGEDSNSSDDLYGIPYNVVHGNSMTKTSVIIDAYDDESDLVPAPIPANPVLEGDYQNRPKVGVDNRGDSHLIVYDVDNNVVYEYYRASRPSENSDGRWHADQQTVWDLKTNTFRTLGNTSADAAGLSILTGLVRPDEGLPVSQGGQGVIKHAIRMTLQNSLILDQFQYPASHTANPGNTNVAIQPPMGARFRLKAGVDISQLDPQSRIIAQAMKDYGMIVADNGSNFYFTGASFAVDANNQQTLTWDDDGIQDSTRGLKSLRFSDFEVVDLTPIVTGLSVSSGAAGNTVTIVGKNFSGAAGNSKVLFGNVAATSVTVVDDSHVMAVVPAGTGTVDVRVQSGATTGTNPDNYESPVFGYGISAVTAAARFTYGAVSNQRPTISTAAAASPSTVTGTTTSLSVLGADDGGEANLRYTWTSTGPASVTYSANGTNASKTSTATFTQPGNYVFTVTIADAAGLTTTSTVNVTVQAAPVNQRPTVATAASATPNTVTGTTTSLSVLGADDGGEANLRYTWSSTGPAAVTYSANGTNAAKRSTATFSKVGNYTITVTIRDAAGLVVTSTIAVTVQQKITSILITPSTATVTSRQQFQFSAAAFDQFGTTMSTAPRFNWSLNGRGSISDNGLYTASRRAGSYTVRASAGGVTGTAKVTVVAPALPTVRVNLLKL